MLPIEGSLAVGAALREANSAMPDAPVVPDEPRGAGLPRRIAARALRALADRLEPPRPAERLPRPDHPCGPRRPAWRSP